MLFAEFFAERSAHDIASLTGAGAEVGFSGLSSRGRQTCHGLPSVFKSKGSETGIAVVLDAPELTFVILNGVVEGLR